MPRAREIEHLTSIVGTALALLLALPGCASVCTNGNDPCCYRTDNGNRLDAPELRMVALELLTPEGVSSPVLSVLIADAIDTDQLNWLLRLEGAAVDGPIGVTIGAGISNADGTYAFLPSVSTGFDPPAVNPVATSGAIANEQVSMGSSTTSVAIPIYDASGFVTALPIDGIEIAFTLSERRSCVGGKAVGGYETSEGSISGYLDAATAEQVPVVTLSSSLCAIVAGADCSNVPQGSWPRPPDTDCSSGVCTSACDPATGCTSWHITGRFAAHGVTIVP